MIKNRMTSTQNSSGRLGNQIIRNIAVSIVAEKHNLYVDYSHYELIKSIGVNLFVGKNNYNTTIELNDDNYFQILSEDNLYNNLESKWHFFQTKNISYLIYRYLHEINQNIINKNPFNVRYNNNNDAFIHIRLTDCAKYNPGIDYYLKSIEVINFDNLYISTDDKNHIIIHQLIEKYPNAILLNYDEVTTFQFSSTCKNIILSHGSFSAIIGYLAFYSTIYYPEHNIDKIWYGDMFSIDGWIKIDFNMD